MHRPFLSVALLFVLAGCSSKSSPPATNLVQNGPSDAGVTVPDSATPSGGVVGPSEDGGVDSGILAARPYTLFVPDSYDASAPTPVVVMMHGYSANGTAEEAFMGLSAAAEAHGFLYAYGNGTLDTTNLRFWNATDACCDFDDIPVDDVAYIDAILADVAAKYNVDSKRTFLVGHSNGGFMAHRYACDRAARVAAIVSLAGAEWEDPTKCAPDAAVSVVQVHGDMDTEISYDGGTIDDRAGNPHVYPSAHQTVATWAAKNGCGATLDDGGTTLPDGGTRSIDTSMEAGATEVQQYAGCSAGGDVELWTMHGSGHLPALAGNWGDAVWQFFSTHPKP